MLIHDRQLHAVDGDAHAQDAYVVPEPGVGTAGPQSLRPIQRLDLLCDDGSVQVFRTEVLSPRVDARKTPGDGVVGAAGRIGGRPVFCYAQDASCAGGSLGTAHADTLVRVQRLARQAGVPIVGFVESAGARMQEGLAALDGYARVFSAQVAASGEVPQISVITGTSAGGGAYSPALGDFVIMTREASMFLTGPAVVREVTGQATSARDLGGADVHARNGVCHFVVESEMHAVLVVRELLALLPPNASTPPPRSAAREPDGPDPGGVVPLEPRRSYDVRTAIEGIVDGGSLLEVSPAWAPNLVTALARVDGQPVGVVANQPRHLSGVLDAEASQKGARFVSRCNAFNLPLVVLVDTPGFLPGREEEAVGVIRHGAGLLHAFASATVPRFTVILRKAFGGAYITMNSKDLGADLTLAWPRAELGIMAAEQAVGVVHRRRLAAADDPATERRRLADGYAAEHLNAQAAARGGHIDAVIRPGETRERLSWALSTLTRGHGARSTVNRGAG